MLGIVLAKFPYREADQLISLFTFSHGKVRCVARGSKKSTSKNAAALEVGSLVRFGLVEGKEFSYLTSIQIEEYFPTMRNQSQQAQIALLICSLIDRLVEERQPDQQLFNRLMETLNILNINKILDFTEVDAFFQDFLVLNGLLEPNVGPLSQKKLHSLIESSFEQKIPNWSNLTVF